ncbi:MAG: DUF4178 domain-containing protein [Nitrospirae bacterium]|nr:MAG: DUF4178 domain-containing protein [Nitrospirota bacterium]
MKANCPSCGAEVVFRSSVSVFSVCDHCQSMIVRHDMDLEALGQMAQLPDDVSPLKIGSRGVFKGKSFGVVGRLKIGWSEGYWNEWFLSFDDGTQGWLAEAMGFFMLSFEVAETKKVPALKALKVGSEYDLGLPQKFTVDDIKAAVCIGSEGELPFRAPKGRKTTSVDLSNTSGEFAGIEYSDTDGVSLFSGKYLDFDSFKFTNLRDLPTELKKVRASGLLKCPSCGGPFSMLTPGHTASAACGYCGSIIDTTNQSLAILDKAEQKMKIKPLIPIGSKGTLFGTKWEVTGFMRRSDEEGTYPWDEYLLFHPTKGFRWLTTYNGHWNFVEMIRTAPEVYLRVHRKWEGRDFQLFLEGKAKVLYVIGEFYWRVRIGETVSVADYICPPEMLSSEGEKSEITWSLGKYIEPEEVAEAFLIREEMPQKVGVAPNQPNPRSLLLRRVGRSFWAFAALLTLFQLYFAFTAKNKEVFTSHYVFNTTEKAPSYVTPSFDIPGGTGNLSATIKTDLQNDWMEAGIDLVDEKSGKSLGFQQTVEHYSGTDGGESWTEGSQDSSYVLAGVKGGRYHLVIQPSADPKKQGEKSFTISLRRGIATWTNYIVGLILLLIYPLCICLKSGKFEAQRKAESSLSSDTDSESDDEEEA